jgi:MerR family transcriptional regulator/heat shock protein HspR
LLILFDANWKAQARLLLKKKTERKNKANPMATKRKNKGAYMISAVAEMYQIHPQTLRLYEREGLLRPSRSEGNTRLYTDEDLERLEFILNLARDLGVNIAGIAVILQMRERMEEMNRQMQGFVDYVRTEMLSRMQQNSTSAGLVPMRPPVVVSPPPTTRKKKTGSFE